MVQVKERGGGGEKWKKMLADKPRDFEKPPFLPAVMPRVRAPTFDDPSPLSFFGSLSFLARPKSVFLCSATQASCCAKVREGAKK